jgi:hypothetical protein
LNCCGCAIWMPTHQVDCCGIAIWMQLMLTSQVNAIWLPTGCWHWIHWILFFRRLPSFICRKINYWHWFLFFRLGSSIYIYKITLVSVLLSRFIHLQKNQLLPFNSLNSVHLNFLAFRWLSIHILCSVLWIRCGEFLDECSFIWLFVFHYHLMWRISLLLLSAIVIIYLYI